MRHIGVIMLLQRGNGAIDKGFEIIPQLGKLRVATRLVYIRYLHEVGRLLFKNGPFAFIMAMAASTLFSLTLFNNELVIITAVYASLLFFKEIFLEPYPLPAYRYTVKLPTEDSEKRAFKVRAENRGDTTLYRPRIKYRILSRDGQTLVPWRPETYHFDDGPSDELEPGESSEFFELNLSETGCYDMDMSPDDDKWDRLYTPIDDSEHGKDVVIEFKVSSRLKKGYVKARDIVFL